MFHMSEESSPNVSLLIVAWNCWRDVERLLASTRDVEYRDFEVVLVDNGSEDGTPENVERDFPGVRIERNATNLGLPPAVNRGLELVRGEFVMLLDADTEVAPDSVGLLVQFMSREPDVSLCAPRIYTPEGTIEETARNFPSLMSGLFGRQGTLTRLFPNNPFARRYLRRDNLGRQDPFRVQQVSAACMFIRRALVDEVGPWDEGFRCYWADTDWCKTIAEHDKQVYCVPAAHVTHHENNRAGKKKSSWRIWHFHMGAYRLYRKHDTFGWLDPRALVALVALGARAGLMLVSNWFMREEEAPLLAEGHQDRS
jgi:GT2 family glycosyltransferase